MALTTLRRLRYPGMIPIAALMIVLFVALDLMSGAVRNSEELNRTFVPLLFLVLLGLLVLAVMVVINVIKLVRRYRQQAAGSRLTGRILIRFVLLSLLPVGVVYYYSLGFLLHGIDSWFDVEIDRAMQDAIALNQASLDLNQRILLKYSQQLLTGLADNSTPASALSLETLRRQASALKAPLLGPGGQVQGYANEDPAQSEQLLAGLEDNATPAAALSLETLRRQAGALEALLLDPDGQVQGYANEDPTQLVPDQPHRELLQRVRSGTNYVGLETRAGGDLVVRVLVADPLDHSPKLQIIFPTSEHISGLSQRLEDAYNRYAELAYLRQSLKLSFSVTLSLVLGFGLMAALIAAFHTARRLVTPVADIARGTRAVAAGDYEQQLPVPRHDDELALLVTSFNTMTQRIAEARDTADRSQRAVEAQRAYLETVLGRLSSGVVSIDPAQRLRTANPAASHILGLSLDEMREQDLAGLTRQHPQVARWVETVQEHLDDPEEWRTEITLFGGEGRQVLLCRGSPLLRPGSDEYGHVVVFDDITTLITAQRDAAWGEVARRLAHEIKNPLTPIQLSAERLRHKLLPKLRDRDAGIVDRATHTIITQVEAMKGMVNDFSSYARTPKMETEPLGLDALVAEVMDLYCDPGSGRHLELRLQAPGARIMGDPRRLRQVIHNLVKNAQEAVEDSAEPRILVATSQVEHAEQRCVELWVQDNGGGIDETLLGTIFDPYVTTKAKGTGLGLAIVKKIIEEHGGIIWVENADAGARLTARLPRWQAEAGRSGSPSTADTIDT
ncbi:sensor histidine kinase [Candidatus Thiosymbion oneisti]|uniref:sensor histidine kinase n=1 Tax=Candidatus Thiosymbion oneisti TaxID=589554 RepID=UPI001FB0A503|nr:ATP-binding protein [Candidatus Thiosymbion oneisti]